VAAAVEHIAFLKTCDFSTVLDAGANKGQFTLAVQCVRPDAYVVGFEPLAGPAGRYARLFANRSNIELRRVALGSKQEQVDIHVSCRDDSSSLLPITEVQTSIFPGTEERGRESVKVVRLDDEIDVAALKPPVLLKMDVQGFELETLKGAVRSLERIEHVYCELSFFPFYAGQPLADEVIAWLATHGFSLAGVYHIANDVSGRAVQADFYFQRP
jgi:FkbM family methyltransferase